MALTDEDRQARLERLNALEQRKDRLEQLLAEAVREQNPGEQYLFPSNHADLPLREVANFRAQRSGFAHFNPQQASIEPRPEFRPVDLESIRTKLDEEAPQPPQTPALQTLEPEPTEAAGTTAGVAVTTEETVANATETAAEINAEVNDSLPEAVENSGEDDLEIPTASEDAEASERS